MGLLDMYGFESRSTNYIEQLVVNAFNEQVQSFYNQSVFQWEMVSVDDQIGVTTGRVLVKILDMFLYVYTLH